MKKPDYFALGNRILLGALELSAGLLKLFVLGPAAVVVMLSGLGFPVPGFFAWVLILAEIGCGAAILAGWKLKYTTIPPAIILTVAGILVFRTDLVFLLVHLVVASNYLLIGMKK